MSINLVIRQRGHRRKSLPLAVLTGSALAYGTQGDFRFLPGRADGGCVILYDPKAIARGIYVTWTKDEKKEIGLRLNQPTSPSEFDDLYYLVQRVCTYWDCTLTCDGQELTLDGVHALIEERKYDNHEILDDIFRRCIDERLELGPTLYGVFNPLTFGLSEARRFAGNHALLFEWMNSMQQQGIICERPAFGPCGDDPLHIRGAFATVEGEHNHAFPYKPTLFEYLPVAEEAGMTCTAWEAVLIPEQDGHEAIVVPFGVFASWVQEQGKTAPYDSATFVLEPLTHDDMLRIEECARQTEGEAECAPEAVPA